MPATFSRRSSKRRMLEYSCEISCSVSRVERCFSCAWYSLAISMASEKRDATSSSRSET